MRDVEPLPVVGELVVRPEPAGELAVYGEPGPSPAGQALVTWTVGVVDGLVDIGGTLVHPSVARDLWLRLGQVVAAAERNGEADEWERLGRELDHQFAAASPATGRSKGAGSVSGVLFRASDRLVLFRVATFAIAYLRPERRGTWEGPVYTLLPITTGHDRRRTEARVRVAGELVESARRADSLLGRPVLGIAASTSAAPSRPPVPAFPAAPVAPAWLRERHADLAALRTRVLDALHEGPLVPGELATRVGLAEEELVAVLESAREVRRVELLRDGRWRGVPERVGLPLPKPRPLGPAPAPGAIPAPKPRRSRAKVHLVPAPPPRPPLRHCFRCSTSSHTTAAWCPRCGSLL